MGLQIPMKITGALQKNTLQNLPQTLRPAYTSHTIQQAGQPQRQQPVQPVQPQRQPIIQQAIPPDSTLLRRGQKFTIAEKNGTVPGSLSLSMNWSVRNPRCTLDTSCFLLAENGKVPGEEWFVFYGQPDSPDRSIRYSGSTETGSELYIQLSKISPQIQKIAFAVTIYEAIPQALNFGMVQSISARILTGQKKELARLELDDCTPSVTALVIGELYRYKGVWKFNAVGSGVRRDLAGFCAMYGIEAGNG